MLRTLFIEEARTQAARNAAATGACCLILLGFLGLWWLLADVASLAFLMQLASMVVIIAIPVVVMVQVAVEYWQSMYGQRGYLTMLIPVRGRVQFAAKSLYACVVALVESAICLGGLVAWFAVLAHSTGSTIGDVLRPVLWAIETAGPGKTTLFVLIMLIGLLAKNAILIVEFALDRRRTGMALTWSAILGAVARLRPILMTSLAMIVGLLPLMFASGVGANGNSTLGASTVGGMLIGMILQIFIVPALFVVFQSLQERFKPLRFDDIITSKPSGEVLQFSNTSKTESQDDAQA